MARNNLTWVKGDITGDIYYDLFKLDSKDIQYLRLYLMVKGVFGAAGVSGLRVCVYGRAVGPTGLWLFAYRQPPGGDRLPPAAQNAQRRPGLRAGGTKEGEDHNQSSHNNKCGTDVPVLTVHLYLPARYTCPSPFLPVRPILFISQPHGADLWRATI